MKNTIPFSKPFPPSNFYLALLFFLPQDFSLFLNLFSILPDQTSPYHSQISGAVKTLGLPIGIPRILFSHFSKKHPSGALYFNMRKSIKKREAEMKKSKRWAGCFVLLVLCFWTASAFGAEKVTVRALGSFTQQIQSTVIEIPFYKRLQQEAGDRLDIQFRTMDELGQKGFQALRQLRGGVFDIIQIQLGYISGDDPYWQALDLMGVAPDLKTAKKLVDV